MNTQLIVTFAGLVIMLILETARPFFDLFREARRERGVHVVRNLIVGSINSALIAVVFVGARITAAAWAQTVMRMPLAENRRSRASSATKNTVG